MSSMAFEWFSCRLQLTPDNVTDVQSEEQEQPNIIELFFEEHQHEEQIELEMGKQFLFEEHLGWIWHKSWLIPQIEVCLDDSLWKVIKTNNKTNSTFLQLASLVQIPGQKNKYKFIKLEQQAIKPLQAKITKFNNFKFKETSFQNNKRPLRLVLMIYSKVDGKKQLIMSQVSSPVYVDSRREARTIKKVKTHEITQKIQIQEFFESIKKHVGKKNMKIPSSTSGFIQYYTSQNIRNKIKNPFYIAFHFSLEIACYYNTQVASSALHALRLIQSQKYDKDIILLLIETSNPQQRKKVEHIANKLLIMKGVIIETTMSLKEDEELGQNWQLVSRRKIAQTYKKYYDRDFQEEKSLTIKSYESKTSYWTSEIVIQIGGPRNRSQPQNIFMCPCKIQQ